MRYLLNFVFGTLTSTRGGHGRTRAVGAVDRVHEVGVVLRPVGETSVVVTEVGNGGHSRGDRGCGTCAGTRNVSGRRDS